MCIRDRHKGAININTDYGLFMQNPAHHESMDTAELAPDPEIKGSRNSRVEQVKRSQEPTKTNPIISSHRVGGSNSNDNTQSGLIKIDKENYP